LPPHAFSDAREGQVGVAESDGADAVPRLAGCALKSQ